MRADNRQSRDDFWAQPWAQPHVSPSVGHRTHLRILLRCFRRVYHPGASVLDVGCGCGTLLGQIRDRFPGVGPLAGTDISETALARARAAVPGARLFRSDVETEPIPTGELFDVVVCSEVLEHLHDWHAGIAHLSGALRPGGRLVVSVPHSMRWWSQVDEAVGHLRRYEKAELSSGFRAGGLLPERVFTWGGPLYHLHRKLLTGRVKLDHTWKHPNWVVVALQKVLYAALFLDDVFVGARIGRFLYGVARRPEPGHPGSALQRRP